MTEKYNIPEKHSLDFMEGLEDSELEQEKKPEKGDGILNPEVIESIMEKKQDIFKYGTPYTSILKTEVFEDVLKNGVLGMPRVGRCVKYDPADPDNTEPDTKEGIRKIYEINPMNWKNNLSRKQKDVTVSFNIQGRSFETASVDSLNSPNDDAYMEVLRRAIKEQKGFSQWFFGIAIIFDISDMKETEPRHQLSVPFYKPIKRGTYAISGPEDNTSKELDEKGNLFTTTEYGFSFPNRIPPRRYRGIVIKNREKLEEVTKSMSKVYKDKPELLVPIYDKEGNMLWPKKVPYSELKKEDKLD